MPGRGIFPIILGNKFNNAVASIFDVLIPLLTKNTGCIDGTIGNLELLH